MIWGEIGLFKLAQTFWGLAVLVGLGGYSVYHAVQPDETSGNSGRDRAPLLAQLPNGTPAPHVTPAGGYPTPSPLTVFLACDGVDADAVRYYVPAPGGSVSLRVDTDRDLVVALLGGEPTRFGGATLVQTPCVRGLIRSGRFP